MRVRELFKSTGLTQSIGGTAIFLDRENCQIVDKTKNENSIVLHLKRESDGEEGRAHLRVQDKFKTISAQLLNWAFASESIVGLTLNQLDDLETNLSIESIGGKLQLKK
ncbi:MAG: hypothetical protein WAV98_02725 [Minisyncoccia bacterium]